MGKKSLVKSPRYTYEMSPTCWLAAGGNSDGAKSKHSNRGETGLV